MELSLSSFDGILRKHKQKKKIVQEESGISALPQDCIARILSLTSPRDACISCLVSWNFKSAADSDDVWDKFLPLDYKDIMARSDSSQNLNNLSSKKELYFRFFTPILLDGSNKSLNLDMATNKVCFMLGSKELTIDWKSTIKWRDTTGRGILRGKITDYWKLISPSHSRFAEAIELVKRSWLLISGKLETRMLSQKTTYVAYLVFKLTNYADGFGCQGDYRHVFAYGIANVSVEFVRGGGSATGTQRSYLDFHYKPRPRVEYEPRQFSNENEGGWMEVPMGEFYNDQGKDGEVEMIIKEMEDGNWKSRCWKRGLIIQGIELRPKGTDV